MNNRQNKSKAQQQTFYIGADKTLTADDITTTIRKLEKGETLTHNDYKKIALISELYETELRTLVAKGYNLRGGPTVARKAVKEWIDTFSPQIRQDILTETSNQKTPTAMDIEIQKNTALWLEKYYNKIKEYDFYAQAYEQYFGSRPSESGTQSSPLPPHLATISKISNISLIATESKGGTPKAGQAQGRSYGQERKIQNGKLLADLQKKNAEQKSDKEKILALSKFQQETAEDAIEAFRDLSKGFDIKKNIIPFTGKAGSGKTYLLNILLGKSNETYEGRVIQGFYGTNQIKKISINHHTTRAAVRQMLEGVGKQKVVLVADEYPDIDKEIRNDLQQFLERHKKTALMFTASATYNATALNAIGSANAGSRAPQINRYIQDIAAMIKGVEKLVQTDDRMVLQNDKPFDAAMNDVRQQMQGGGKKIQVVVHDRRAADVVKSLAKSGDATNASTTLRYFVTMQYDDNGDVTYCVQNNAGKYLNIDPGSLGSQTYDDRRPCDIKTLTQWYNNNKGSTIVTIFQGKQGVGGDCGPLSNDTDRIVIVPPSDLNSGYSYSTLGQNIWRNRKMQGDVADCTPNNLAIYVNDKKSFVSMMQHGQGIYDDDKKARIDSTPVPRSVHMLPPPQSDVLMTTQSQDSIIPNSTRFADYKSFIERSPHETIPLSNFSTSLPAPVKNVQKEYYLACNVFTLEDAKIGGEKKIYFQGGGTDNKALLTSLVNMMGNAGEDEGIESDDFQNFVMYLAQNEKKYKIDVFQGLNNCNDLALLQACKDCYPGIHTPKELCDKVYSIRKFASAFQNATSKGGLRYDRTGNGLTAPRAVILLAALQGTIDGKFGYIGQNIEEAEKDNFPKGTVKERTSQSHHGGGPQQKMM